MQMTGEARQRERKGGARCPVQVGSRAIGSDQMSVYRTHTHMGRARRFSKAIHRHPLLVLSRLCTMPLVNAPHYAPWLRRALYAPNAGSDVSRTGERPSTGEAAADDASSANEQGPMRRRRRSTAIPSVSPLARARSPPPPPPLTSERRASLVAAEALAKARRHSSVRIDPLSNGLIQVAPVDQHISTLPPYEITEHGGVDRCRILSDDTSAAHQVRHSSPSGGKRGRRQDETPTPRDLGVTARATKHGLMM